MSSPDLEDHLNNQVSPERVFNRTFPSRLEEELRKSRKVPLNRQTNVTLHLDVLAAQLITRKVTEHVFQYEYDHGHLMRMKSEDLILFRAFNDLCHEKPQGNTGLQHFINSTERIHSYYFIQRYDFDRRVKESCFPLIYV